MSNPLLRFGQMPIFSPLMCYPPGGVAGERPVVSYQDHRPRQREHLQPTWQGYGQTRRVPLLKSMILS